MLQRVVNATQLLSAEEREGQCSCLDALETLGLIKFLATQTVVS